jgi:cytoskeleton protein RodZ
MSIGADLATARRQAGMSVAEVSQQTRIRESLIQSIERDDFAACGADFYARGHIRAIAHAIGVDPVPLVQEYDASRGATPTSTARAGAPVGSTARVGVSPGGTARAGVSPAGTARTDAPPTGAAPMVIPSISTATRDTWTTSTPGTAAGAPGPSGPEQPGPRRKRAWAIALLIVLVAGLGVVIYRAEATHHPAAAAGGTHKPAAHHAAHKHRASATAHHGPRHLVISVRAVGQPCWTELTFRHGGTIFQNLIYPGTVKTWTLRRDVILRLGNPPAVRLKIDGKLRTGLGPNPVTLRLKAGHRASS